MEKLRGDAGNIGSKPLWSRPYQIHDSELTDVGWLKLGFRVYG